MPGTVTRLRTRLNIWRHGLWRYRVTATGVVLAAFGAAAAINNPPRLISVIAATAGALVSALEIRSNQRRERNVRFQSRGADDYAEIVAQAQQLGPVLRGAQQVGVVMAAETARLRNTPISVDIEQRPYVLGSRLKGWSYGFLATREKAATMYDGLTIGMANDVPCGDEESTVRLRPARYFDFFCSNLLAPFDVYEMGRPSPVLRGRELIADRHHRLISLGKSGLANTVGVSVLAFTTDGKLLVTAQSKGNVGSPGLVAPSGSGALDPTDLMAGDEPRSLQDIMTGGALRELREECHIRPEEIEEHDILGHGRWISRGAMPEFCSVALLKHRWPPCTKRGSGSAPRGRWPSASPAWLSA